MKRLTLAVSLLALSLQVPAVSHAIEFSGNASILAGWQHDDGSALGGINPAGVPFGFGGEFALIRGTRAPDRDTFNFYLDQIELDIEHSFSDRIRLRADLDFGRFLSGSGRTTEGANFIVEQAYGAFAFAESGEFVIGRFNAPVGYYVVDRAFNPTVSYSTIYQQLTPTNVTGAKVYYAFNDTIDLQAYIMNNMFDCLQIGGTCLTGPRIPGFTSTEDSAVPSWGMRLGFNWGEGDTASTVGISYMGGPEQGTNDHLDHLFDLDFAFKVSESLLVAGEGIYYQRNNLPTFAGLPNGKYWGGLLVIDWQATEIWDLFFSTGYTNDFQGVVTGLDQSDLNFLVGFGYQVTDGVKFKMEYRADLFNYATNQGPQTAVPGLIVADTSSWSHGVAGEFAFTF